MNLPILSNIYSITSSIKLIFSPLSLLLLAACGGGGAGSVSNGSSNPLDPPASNSTLRNFSNGLSIQTQSMDSLSNNQTETFVTLTQNGEVQMVTEVYDLSTVEGQIVNRETDRATLKVTSNAIIGTDKFSGAKAILRVLVEGDPAIAIAGGNIATNVPTSGDYQYDGTLIGGNIDGTNMKDGQFILTVNFGNGTGHIHGSVPFDSFWINGPISVDNSNGTFSGQNVESHFGEEQDYFATSEVEIYGNFHNDGATGVSGLLIEKSENPTFGGAIIGSGGVRNAQCVGSC